MTKRHLLKLLLFLPALALANSKGVFDLKRSGQRHRVKERWMDLRQSFHYFDYDSRDEMGYGILRVLDDFTIARLTGTPIHPHRNVEILTILLKGRIFHQDTLGNSGILQEGEIQLMSAGSGLKHAETNPSQFDEALGFQIWLSPKLRDTPPSYQQKIVAAQMMANRLHPLVSPNKEEGSLAINQDALIYRGQFTRQEALTVTSRFKGNGFYLFVIEGSVEVEGARLQPRDAVGINKNRKLEIICEKGSDLLLFDIPMEGLF